MAKLSGKELTEARRKKGWTQVELSEATKPKVNVSTISRIERGKPSRVRANTLRALAKALDVQPASLCPTPEAERDVMKLRIESAARNALTLVALRYGITRENIIEVAPLLFFIAAEQSLQQRRDRVAELQDSAYALFKLQSSIRHLPPHWALDDSAVNSEEQSIKTRDLFGIQVLEFAEQFMIELDADFDEAEQNPFVAFLRDGLSKISNSQQIAASVRWQPGLWPKYEICAEEVAVIVGNDATAVQAILCGAAALHEMPKGSPEQRADWARMEYDRKYSWFDGFPDDLRGDSTILPTTNGQKSNPGDGS